MHRTTRKAFLAALGAAFLFPLAACGRDAKEESRGDVVLESNETSVRIADIDLGRAIGTDNRVTDKTDEFKADETIYASVVTNGSAPAATLKAVWTFRDGQVVDESSQTIAPSGEAVTEFHISKPAGWPKGKYKLEVFLDGTSAGTEEFEVK